ncbi:cyclic nucleotide-binding domain-containing protein [candidate division CSSED10-310 bacterium]|uniref:Cyclic nucleotide-binding domain-containing protein n=1 Tax=candidate division CSSED10-310 bacterium TaxID=2855610 RepID=A0ABV6Z0V8_UNCC1
MVPRSTILESNQDLMLKVAIMLSLIGFLLSLFFLLNMTGGTLFMFMVPGTICFSSSILIYLWALYTDFIRQHALFEELEYSAQTILFNQGDPGDTMFIIKEGIVEVYREAQGERQTVCQLSVGDYFGEMALLAHGKRTASVVAITDIKVVMIGRKNFDSLISHIPLIGQEIRSTFQRRKMESSPGN